MRLRVMIDIQWRAREGAECTEENEAEARGRLADEVASAIKGLATGALIVEKAGVGVLDLPDGWPVAPGDLAEAGE